MKIGLFSDTFPPEINGVATSTRILRDALLKHGHEVYVITTYNGDGSEKWDDDGMILRLPGMELKFLYGYVMTSPFHAHAIDEIRKLELDLIHVQTEFGVGIFARLVARQLKIPLVSTYHTTYEDYTHYVNFIHSKTIDALAKKGVAKLSKMYGDSSMQVIAPSVKTKKMLEGYHIRREIDVIPTGLELDRFDPEGFTEENRKDVLSSFGISPDSRVIVYVGRLAQEKALDIVVNGFADAIRQGADVHLLIVGGGPDEERLKKMTEKLQMEDRIHVVGPRDASLVPSIYKSCDAFVSASLSETQGMTFIEALASGLPLFARRDDVLTDLLIPEKTGWFFEDAADLAVKVKEFLKIPRQDVKAMREDCMEVVKKYSSDAFCESVLKVYERAIEQYRHQFSITDVRVRDSVVQVYLISNKKEELRLKISMDDYSNYGLRQGGVITLNSVRELQEKEKAVSAYQGCIRRITYKDRTRRQIYDWLTKKTECNIETINDIVSQLEEKGYIDDRRYCREKIASMKASLKGGDRIIRELVRDGIPMDLATEILAEEPDDENTENAVRLAEKTISSHKGISSRKMNAVIRKKLIENGYSSETADEVFEQIDLSDVRLREADSLQKCASKAKKRYERKYTGTELRNHVFRYCAAQGFEVEKIYAVLDGMEWKE